ncbi:lytic transglycosylase domain-containing protein [Roseomonas sp. CCTCC AB2023176]|uniref:lytic transglycosylase domain-containing protein n=1 Tax=Roseomonas sp. CCTCC AB2023176 TaxID=3342640 RepID=UPI0035D7A04D
MARLPAGGTAPALPAAPEAEAAAGPELPPEEREPAAATRNVTRNPALDRTVRDMIGRGEHAAALAHIARTRGMTPAYAAALQTEVAQSLFAAGQDAEALRVASAAARQPGAPAQAAFVAGLSAWGLGQYETALPQFEAAARSDAAPAVLRSAAAFWTARAAVRARRPQAYVPWMLQAAQEPRTFYGLLARRSLGLPFGFAWEGDVAGEAETRALTETAGGWRALALLQVGQRTRAEAELRLLLGAARGNASLNRAMLAVATSAGMADLATDLAAAAQRADGRPRDFARYPVPALAPQGGWRVDPALIYGLARQESNFDPSAVSPAGARGLMQVMPATAAYITGNAALRDEARERLHDPAFSLDLAQRYLVHLSGQDGISGDLIRMLVAYNAGPGNLQRWLPARQHRDDPFLFIESIPYAETRAFVQRVLGYSFIYASRLGLPAPALDTLAAGGSPRLVGVEELARMVARARQGGGR